MVLALVFLPAFAEVMKGSGGGELQMSALLWELGITVGKIALFVALMLVGGKRLVPWLLAAGSAHRLARAVHARRVGYCDGDRVWIG